MDKRILTWMFVLILLVPMVSAKITQVSAGSTGLIVEVPVRNYIKAGQNITLHTHVSNYTNGFPMNPSDYSCNVDLYNTTGSHILQELMLNAGSGVEKKLMIPADITSTPAEYGFYIWCNTSSTGGFVRGSVQATENGKEPYSNPIAFAIILFAAAGIILAIISILSKEHFLLRFFLFFIVFLILYLMSNLGIHITPDGFATAESFFKLMTWLYRIFVIYVSLYFTYTIFLWKGWVGK